MNDATLPAAGLAAAALPVSTRVMNLATFLTQSARRLPDQVALVMGERHRQAEARGATATTPPPISGSAAQTL